MIYYYNNYCNRELWFVCHRFRIGVRGIICEIRATILGAQPAALIDCVC
jgi:hypothetical protein